MREMKKKLIIFSMTLSKLQDLIDHFTDTLVDLIERGALHKRRSCHDLVFAVRVDLVHVSVNHACSQRFDLVGYVRVRPVFRFHILSHRHFTLWQCFSRNNWRNAAHS